MGSMIMYGAEYKSAVREK